MDIKKVLKNNNFTFEKRYGQNFLTDENLLSEMVEGAGVDKNSTVVEIGMGAGTLTMQIAKRVKKVFGFEIDTKLKPILAETLKDYDNIEITYNDIMKIKTEDLEKQIGGKYTVIANLPYYITTPIIMRFIEEAKNCESIIVTIQKEVAERITADAGDSEYGAITASINAVADSVITMYIGREKFLPPPNVDSAVVKITLNKDKYDIKDIKEYRKLIKSAFLMRRKTLVNNLIKAYPLSREQVENILTMLGFKTDVRGEDLSSQDYVNLYNEISKL